MTKRHRFGFTLVELLVVIGIITILVAMLLPVLNKVRAQSQTVVCLSNLSQLGNVVFSYVAENKQRLPYNGLVLATAVPSYPNQLVSPLAGLESEERMPRGAIQPVYRGFSPTSNQKINTPGFLICPTEAVEGLHTSDTLAYIATSGYYEAIAPGRFRNTPVGTTVPMRIVSGADEGAAIYSEVGSPGTINQVFSHYTFNTICLRNEQTSDKTGLLPLGSESLNVNGKTMQYSSVFANYTDTADPTYGLFPQEAPIPITKVVYPGETWMANDGGGSESGGPVGITMDGAVFCHQNHSCNFLYFDGHAENLMSTEIDGYTYAGRPNLSSNVFTVIRDLRMFAVR